MKKSPTPSRKRDPMAAITAAYLDAITPRDLGDVLQITGLFSSPGEDDIRRDLNALETARAKDSDDRRLMSSKAHEAALAQIKVVLSPDLQKMLFRVREHEEEQGSIRTDVAFRVGLEIGRVPAGPKKKATNAA